MFGLWQTVWTWHRHLGHGVGPLAHHRRCRGPDRPVDPGGLDDHPHPSTRHEHHPCHGAGWNCVNPQFEPPEHGAGRSGRVDEEDPPPGRRSRPACGHAGDCGQAGDPPMFGPLLAHLWVPRAAAGPPLPRPGAGDKAYPLPCDPRTSAQPGHHRGHSATGRPDRPPPTTVFPRRPPTGIRHRRPPQPHRHRALLHQAQKVARHCDPVRQACHRLPGGGRPARDVWHGQHHPGNSGHPALHRIRSVRPRDQPRNTFGVRRCRGRERHPLPAVDPRSRRAIPYPGSPRDRVGRDLRRLDDPPIP
ncbi:hypothetical protein DFQ13_104442 [Actinokineospora spheciospongiae]|nr:hypothetical protein DFQ13_104442 [Actinokineospora spheciospongiae]